MKNGNQPPRVPNRVVERDPYSQRYQIWHADDRGDLYELAFDLPAGLRRETVEKAFREKGQHWIDWRTALGWKVNPATIVCHGPYPCLELDKLDMQRYIISARWWRTKPLEVGIDEAQELLGAQPDQPLSVAYMHEQAQKGNIEANARATEQAKRKVDENREAWAQMDKERRERGLQPYKEE